MRWKWFVQTAFGGVRRVPHAHARVRPGHGDKLAKCHLGITQMCLNAILEGVAPVLIYQGAVPKDLCREASRRLEAVASGPLGKPVSEPVGPGSHCTRRFAQWYLGAHPDAPASDYMKVGYTKTDVFREEGFRMAAGRCAPESYLRCAAQTTQFLESEIFAPHLCPIDSIRDELAALPGIQCRVELCPATKRPFLPCVVRRMVPGGRRSTGNIHMDTLAPGRTLSINVYLQVPEGDSGGELVLYPVKKDALARFLNHHFFDTLDVQNFFPDRSFYPEEFLTSGKIEPILYRPRVGDVVIIDPAYPHAVHDFGVQQQSAPSAAIVPEVGTATASRLSLQTFVQVSQESNVRLLEYAT